MLCSAYDLFMKYCLTAGGTCFAINGTLTGKFFCCMSNYYPGNTKGPTLSAEKYVCAAGETVGLFIECGVPSFTWETTGGIISGLNWMAPVDGFGEFLIKVIDACEHSSQITITVTGPPDPLPPGHWGNQIGIMIWEGWRGMEAGQLGSSASMGWPLSYDPPAGWYYLAASEPLNIVVPEQWVYYAAGSRCFGPYHWTITETVNNGWYGAVDCLSGIPRAWDAVSYPKATRWIPDE